MDDYIEQQRASRKRQQLATKHLRYMLPKHRFELAREILNELADSGVTYADFQAAKSAQEHIRAARTALYKVI